MTTEIWVTDFYNETKQIIPDGERLSSAQKSLLIKHLNTYLPQSHQTNVAGLSPDQFGRIIDMGNGLTSISTPRRVDIGIEGSDKYRRLHGTWNKPLLISQEKKEIVFIILAGYSVRKPISVQNVSSESQ